MGDSLPTIQARPKGAGLGRHADRLAELTRPSIRLLPQGIADAALETGQTRLGGNPDLPASTRWPEYRGVPQSFIAQINLADVQQYDLQHQLPDAGLLSFFYDAEQSVWGFDPAQNDGWKVLYTEASVDVGRREFPAALPVHSRFRPITLQPHREITYAPLGTELEAVGLSPDDGAAYDELIEADGAPLHRLLGHPDPIQGDMQLECQLASHGLYVGDPSGYRDSRAADLRAGAVDWRLLLQIDSDEEADMMWGDAGRIYYWMHKDAMRERRWDEAWLILQCF